MGTPGLGLPLRGDLFPNAFLTVCAVTAGHLLSRRGYRVDTGPGGAPEGPCRVS